MQQAGGFRFSGLFAFGRQFASVAGVREPVLCFDAPDRLVGTRHALHGLSPLAAATMLRP